jgi:hypothetical protein
MIEETGFHSFVATRHPDSYYPYHYENVEIEPDEMYCARWWLHGQKGENAWTDEELVTVCAYLIQRPRARPLPWHGTACWALWKHPACSIDSDQRPTYYLDVMSGGQVHWTDALRGHDLVEVLEAWKTIYVTNSEPLPLKDGDFYRKLYRKP